MPAKTCTQAKHCCPSLRTANSIKILGSSLGHGRVTLVTTTVKCSDLSGSRCGYGHNRQEITDAVSQQLATLDYAPAFQYTHPSATTLAERLREPAPGDLNHVLFTNSGSECADTALKLARATGVSKDSPARPALSDASRATMA